MPDLDGIDILKHIKALNKDTEVCNALSSDYIGDNRNGDAVKTFYKIYFATPKELHENFIIAMISCLKKIASGKNIQIAIELLTDILMNDNYSDRVRNYATSVSEYLSGE